MSDHDWTAAAMSSAERHPPLVVATRLFGVLATAADRGFASFARWLEGFTRHCWAHPGIMDHLAVPARGNLSMFWGGVTDPEGRMAAMFEVVESALADPPRCDCWSAAREGQWLGMDELVRPMGRSVEGRPLSVGARACMCFGEAGGHRAMHISVAGGEIRVDLPQSEQELGLGVEARRERQKDRDGNGVPSSDEHEPGIDDLVGF